MTTPARGSKGSGATPKLKWRCPTCRMANHARRKSCAGCDGGRGDAPLEDPSEPVVLTVTSSVGDASPHRAQPSSQPGVDPTQLQSFTPSQQGSAGTLCPQADPPATSPKKDKKAKKEEKAKRDKKDKKDKRERKNDSATQATASQLSASHPTQSQQPTQTQTQVASPSQRTKRSRSPLTTSYEDFHAAPQPPPGPGFSLFITGRGASVKISDTALTAAKKKLAEPEEAPPAMTPPDQTASSGTFFETGSGRPVTVDAESIRSAERLLSQPDTGSADGLTPRRAPRAENPFTPPATLHTMQRKRSRSPPDAPAADPPALHTPAPVAADASARRPSMGGGLRASGLKGGLVTPNVAKVGTAMSSRPSGKKGFTAPRARSPPKGAALHPNLVGPAEAPSQTPRPALHPSAASSSDTAKPTRATPAKPSAPALKALELPPAMLMAAGSWPSTPPAALPCLSHSAAGFRFHATGAPKDDGIPRHADGGIGPDECREALLSLGAHPPAVCREWVQAQFRWSVWKVANHARRSPTTGGGAGSCFTPVHVMAELARRYNEEFVAGRRPVLRRVTEQDAVASGTMVLAVAAVLDPRAPGARLELTDGWYSLPASCDPPLSQLVRAELIVPGAKLVVHGATYSTTEPSPPLQVPQSAALSLCYNGVRPAAPDAPLGSAGPDDGLAGDSSAPPVVPVVPAALVHSQGGLVPSLRGEVVRVLGTIFMERVDGRKIVRNRIAEERRAASAYNALSDADLVAAAHRNGDGAAPAERDVTAVAAFLVRDGEETVVVQVWRAPPDGYDDITVGARLRLFSLVPSRHERAMPPLAAMKLLFPKRHLMYHVEERAPPAAAHTAPPSESVLSVAGVAAHVRPGTVVDVAAVVLAVCKAADADAQRWVLCDVAGTAGDCLLAVLDAASHPGAKEIGMPRVDPGQAVVLQNAVFERFDDTAARDVVHLAACEYTTVALRPATSTRHGMAMAGLKAQLEQHRSVVGALLQDDAVAAVANGGAFGTGGTIGTTAAGNAAAAAKGAVPLLACSADDPAAPRRTISAAAGNPSKASLLYGASSGTPSVSPTTGGASPLQRTLFQPTPPVVIGDGLRHVFGNVLPNSVVLVLGAEARTAPLFEDDCSPLHASLRKPTDPAPPSVDEAAAASALAVFDVATGDGRALRVCAPAGALFDCVEPVGVVSTIAATDDMLQVARGAVLRDLHPGAGPTPQGSRSTSLSGVSPTTGAAVGNAVGSTEALWWSRALAHSVVVGAADWSSIARAAESQGSAPQGSQGSQVASQGDGRGQARAVSSRLASGLVRWNAAAVPAEQVVWWHAEEWQQLLRRMIRAWSDRLVKLTLAPPRADAGTPESVRGSLGVEGLFWLSPSTPIDVLYA